MTNILLFTLGLFFVYTTVASVIKSFVLPRATTDFLRRAMFGTLRVIFIFITKFTRSYYKKDKILALFAPVGLLSLPPLWLTIIAFGYSLMFYATGINDFQEAFTISSSSILTLGFAKGTTLTHYILSFTAATIGLGLVALLIAYLPTLYTEFSSREVSVNQLSVRAGEPPSPVEMLKRFHRLERLSTLTPLWERWETWFVRLEESHTSFSVLVFFRSPLPDHSWVNAAGTILDAAALRLSILELPDEISASPLPDGRIVPGDPGAAIMLRAGFLALRRIADVFNISHPSNPQYPQEPISISREEFNFACRLFEEQGMTIKNDRDQAWKDFSGWRVNYDSVLTSLQKLTFAIPAPWIADHEVMK